MSDQQFKKWFGSEQEFVLGIALLCANICIFVLCYQNMALAQVYEKSGSALKVTRQVEETYNYSDIKLKIQDLKDMQGEVLSRANDEIAKLQAEIDMYTKLLSEADKLEIGNEIDK